MLGGYQILDLRGIDLEKSQSASDITNANVLNQLLKLRDYIDKAYNFSKPLENQLKPVLIRFRDKKVNEKIEGATFGELSLVDNYYSFKITARLSGVLVLTINVTFEEVENGYGNYEWIIDDATIQLADETQIIDGDVTIDGDLSVTGSINGESNPSVRPVWFHPLTLYSGGNTITINEKEYSLLGSATILNNSQSALNGSLANIYSAMLGAFTRLNTSMILYNLTDDITIHVIQLYVEENHIYVIGFDSQGIRHDESANAIDLYSVRENINVVDAVNKIN